MASFVQTNFVDFEDTMQKINAYIRVYDGKSKSYSEMEGAFEDLFHDEFVHTMSERPIDKYQLRETVKTFLSAGTKAELLLFKPLDHTTFEVRLHFANHLADTCTHSMGIIKDGKIVKLEAYGDAIETYKKWEKIVELSTAKYVFEHFIELQNNKNASSESVAEVFDGLFFDSLIAAVNRAQLEERGMRTTSSVPQDFSRAIFSIGKCEFMDENHIEVEVQRNCNSVRQVWHDVLTVKDGTIIMIEPFVQFKNIMRSLGLSSSLSKCDSSPFYSSQ